MPARTTVGLVLLVEDEFLIRLPVADALRAEGWEVLEASTGETALEHFAAADIHLLFTDIQLGGHLNGWDVAEALREREPTLPVIYASAVAQDRSRQVADAKFFSKPYAHAEIVAACQNMIAGG
jgi:DNA-binding response OmpR family regulator